MKIMNTMTIKKQVLKMKQSQTGHTLWKQEWDTTKDTFNKPIPVGQICKEIWNNLERRATKLAKKQKRLNTVCSSPIHKMRVQNILLYSFTINKLTKYYRNAVINNVSDISAVSYTHLDVYKRQLLARALYDLSNQTLIWQPQIAKHVPGRPHCSGAVSYTHLDVYKRQLQCILFEMIYTY